MSAASLSTSLQREFSSHVKSAFKGSMQSSLLNCCIFFLHSVLYVVLLLLKTSYSYRVWFKKWKVSLFMFSASNSIQEVRQEHGGKCCEQIARIRVCILSVCDIHPSPPTHTRFTYDHIVATNAPFHNSQNETGLTFFFF